MSAATDALAEAIDERECEARDVLCRLREEDLLSGEEVRVLREALTLLGCLRRLLPERTMVEIHDAFGAPGGFGYDTPVGDALYRLYRSGAS